MLIIYGSVNLPSINGNTGAEFMHESSPRSTGTVTILVEIRVDHLEQDRSLSPCKSLIGPFRLKYTGCCQKIRVEKGFSAYPKISQIAFFIPPANQYFFRINANQLFKGLHYNWRFNWCCLGHLLLKIGPFNAM